jgi:hypothetical protein
LEPRAWIGDGDEMPAGGAAESGGRAGKKIFHQNVRFERRARLAGHNEQGARDIDAALETPYLLRIGGIEHVQFRVTRCGSQALCQHLGAEARSPHAEEQHIGEILGAQLPAEILHRSDVVQLAVDDVEPA